MSTTQTPSQIFNFDYSIGPDPLRIGLTQSFMEAFIQAGWEGHPKDFTADDADKLISTSIMVADRFISTFSRIQRLKDQLR